MFLLVAVIVLWPRVAMADTIVVDAVGCTLPEAITAANTDAAFDGCSAGNGDDLLLLTAPNHELATGPFDHVGMTATPSIVSTIVISGGVGGATITRSGDDPYRLFHVGNGGDLTLANVVVRAGNSPNQGGAIYNSGQLTLRASQIISNTALSGGGIYNFNGTLSLTASTLTVGAETTDRTVCRAGVRS